MAIDLRLSNVSFTFVHSCVRYRIIFYPTREKVEIFIERQKRRAIRYVGDPSREEAERLVRLLIRKEES